MTDDTIKDALIKARALIQDPKHWTQGTMAKARNGRHVKPENEEAIRFCVLGALRRIGAPSTAMSKLDNAALKLYGCAAVYLNDYGSNGYIRTVKLTRSTIHKQILAAYDQAIKECDPPP